MRDADGSPGSIGETALVSRSQSVPPVANDHGRLSGGSHRESLDGVGSPSSGLTPEARRNRKSASNVSEDFVE